MSVSQEYRQYVLEQLGRIAPVTSRNMFGGVGIYANGLFFALIDDDTLYLKTDDSNRAAFEGAGYGAFHPFGDERAMKYHELPADVLEDADALRPWVAGAVAAASAARRAKS